jgi:hypothetical protein
MRVMTAHRRAGAVLPEDVPNYAAHSGKFMWKLLAAWVWMGFRTPRVEGVPPDLRGRDSSPQISG